MSTQRTTRRTTQAGTLQEIHPDVLRLVSAFAEEGVALEPGTDLIDEEVLDSLGIFTLVGTIEEELGISIEPDEVTLDNFGTLAAIDALVRSKRT